VIARYRQSTGKNRSNRKVQSTELKMSTYAGAQFYQQRAKLASEVDAHLSTEERAQINKLLAVPYKNIYSTKSTKKRLQTSNQVVINHLNAIQKVFDTRSEQFGDALRSSADGLSGEGEHVTDPPNGKRKRVTLKSPAEIQTVSEEYDEPQPKRICTRSSSKRNQARTPAKVVDHFGELSSSLKALSRRYESLQTPDEEYLEMKRRTRFVELASRMAGNAPHWVQKDKMAMDGRSLVLDKMIDQAEVLERSLKQLEAISNDPDDKVVWEARRLFERKQLATEKYRTALREEEENATAQTDFEISQIKRKFQIDLDSGRRVKEPDYDKGYISAQKAIKLAKNIVENKSKIVTLSKGINDFDKHQKELRGENFEPYKPLSSIPIHMVPFKSKYSHRAAGDRGRPWISVNGGPDLEKPSKLKFKFQEHEERRRLHKLSERRKQIRRQTAIEDWRNDISSCCATCVTGEFEGIDGEEECITGMRVFDINQRAKDLSDNLRGMGMHDNAWSWREIKEYMKHGTVPACEREPFSGEPRWRHVRERGYKHTYDC
jgi:hypothetical protein